MRVQTYTWPIVAGALVAPGASAALVSIDSQQSTLFAGTAIDAGETDPMGMSPVDWTGQPSFNASSNDVNVASPSVQVTAASTQNNVAGPDFVSGEGQVSGFGTTDGSGEVDSDALSRFELVFTIDGPTFFNLDFTLSSFDVGDSTGDASWTLEEIGGLEIATLSVVGNAFQSGSFATLLPSAGQYSFTIESRSDVSGGLTGPAFSSASGGFTFAVVIPTPGAGLVVAGLAMALPLRRRRA